MYAYFKDIFASWDNVQTQSNTEFMKSDVPHEDKVKCNERVNKHAERRKYWILGGVFVWGGVMIYKHFPQDKNSSKNDVHTLGLRSRR